MERNRCQEDRGIPQPALFAGEDMPRKPLDIRFTDYPGQRERGISPFPASGEDGSGQSPEKKLWRGAPSGGDAFLERQSPGATTGQP